MGKEYIVAETTTEFFQISEQAYLTEYAVKRDVYGQWEYGEELGVTWDGTDYLCVFGNRDGYPYLGNGALQWGDISDTGEPFVFAYDGWTGLMLFTTDTGTTHTFSIWKQTADSGDTMDKDYLKKLFINEVKGALKSCGGGLPVVEITTVINTGYMDQRVLTAEESTQLEALVQAKMPFIMKATTTDNHDVAFVMNLIRLESDGSAYYCPSYDTYGQFNIERTNTGKWYVYYEVQGE